MGDNPDVEVDGEEVFRPKEFIQALDDFSSEIFGDNIGHLVGMVYAGLTVFLFVSLAYGIFFIMNSSNLQFADKFNISLLSISIGSLLLAGGSSLANHFDKKDLRYTSYISNSIIFISSGICFLTASIFEAYLTGTDNFVLTYTFGALSYWLNFIGAISISSALWVFLKLLWRLQQLVSVPESERNYDQRDWTGASPLIGLTAPFMISGVPILLIELARITSIWIVLSILGVLSVLPHVFSLYTALQSKENFLELLNNLWSSKYVIMFYITIILLSYYLGKHYNLLV
jgi:hypothetical protein